MMPKKQRAAFAALCFFHTLFICQEIFWETATEIEQAPAINRLNTFVAFLPALHDKYHPSVPHLLCCPCNAGPAFQGSPAAVANWPGHHYKQVNAQQTDPLLSAIQCSVQVHP